MTWFNENLDIISQIKILSTLLLLPSSTALLDVKQIQSETLSIHTRRHLLRINLLNKYGILHVALFVGPRDWRPNRSKSGTATRHCRKLVKTADGVSSCCLYRGPSTPRAR